MRLLFVHDRFGALAGAEVNAYLTGLEFSARGHSVALLHGKQTGQGELEWRELFAQRFALDDDDPAATTRTALASFRPDAVYVHKMSDLDVLDALVHSACPLVRMVHDHELYCLRSYKYFPLTRNVCTRAAGAYCVFPCGGALARSRNNGFPLKWRSYRAKKQELRLNRRFHCLIVASHYMKTELLRNGFDTDRIKIHPPVPRSSEPLSQSSFSGRNRIVYAGQIIRGKGVDVLLEALAQIRVPFECVVLGEGHFRRHCEKLADTLGLRGRVSFEGYVPPASMAPFYADASLAAVSSVWPEPFGAVGLEAMRHGLPVVAFDCGGIGEWLISGRNGFLVPWMDRKQFAARIEQLLRDKPLARQMGAWGRQFARDNFHFGQYISALEKMFASVISKQQSKAVS